MFEKFTEKARQAVMQAAAAADDLGHGYMGTEHLLLALLSQSGTVAREALENVGVPDKTIVCAKVISIVGGREDALPRVGAGGSVPTTPRVKKVLELALREALALGHNFIGTEHILLGLVRENSGVACRVLGDYHIEPEDVRSEVVRLLAGGPAVKTTPAVEDPFREMHESLALKFTAIGQHTFAKVMRGELRPGDLSEESRAQLDAELTGTGYLFKGKRVSPADVRVFSSGVSR